MLPVMLVYRALAIAAVSLYTEASACVSSYCMGSRLSIPRPLLNLNDIQKGVYSIKFDSQDTGRVEALESLADFIVDESISPTSLSPTLRIELHDALHKHEYIPLLDLCLGIASNNAGMVTIVSKSERAQLQHTFAPLLYLTQPNPRLICDSSVDVQYVSDFAGALTGEIIDWVTEDGLPLAPVPR